MRLTRHSDYALRTLIFAGLRGDELSTVGELSERYGLSRNHLMKVVNMLHRQGHIETVRGKRGGFRLAREPEAIRVGAVLRDTEPDWFLVECFGPDNHCCIAPACRLKGALHEALAAFLAVLDRYTLADLLAERRQLTELLWPGDAPIPRRRDARDQ